MAVIKCKMCGGDLNITEGSPVAECEYCGAKQTVPSQDNEKKLALFARADRLRRSCEFDKAAGVYESIVAEFPEEAEAYWGLVLCRYGIEYVDSPATGKKVPTCHRSSFDSIMEDSDFDQACENADPVARRVYREEAKAIEELRKGILEVSGKEEPYDIFICYKEADENGERTVDSVIAQDVYDALTEKGYRVFFSRVSLEDKLGTEYEPYIFAALNSARVMLVFGTDYEYFNAVWVKNEWSRFLCLIAAGQKKTLIPCYKDIDAYDMPKEFAKLQAQDMGKVGAIQDLLRGVDKILGKGAQATAEKAPEAVRQSGGPTVESLLKRGYLSLEDHNWDKAEKLFDQVLSIAPECAEAYLGLVMSGRYAATREDFKQGFLEAEYDASNYFARAKQFATGDLKSWFEELEEDRKKAQEEKQRMWEKARETFRARVAPLRKTEGLILACAHQTFGLRVDGRVLATGNNSNCQCSVSRWRKIVAVTGDYSHTVGLKADGTVVAAGNYSNGRCDVSGWQNIVAVSTADAHTVVLKADGTVVATGSNGYGECNVSDWRNIVAISVGANHTVGLRADGTVVATGNNEEGQCSVADWRDIVSVAADDSHTVGLWADGTVRIIGKYYCDQSKVRGWSNIMAIATSGRHVVGLRADGTVMAVGSNDYGECEVADWRDIVAVAVGPRHTVGLRVDGTVVATGENNYGQCNVSDWQDIVAISAGMDHTVGLRTDGTVVAVGSNLRHQCKVSKWKLFDSLDELEHRRVAPTAQQEEACRVSETEDDGSAAALKREMSALQTELAGLKGLFAGRRHKQIMKRLAEIETKLKNHDWS